MQCEHAADQALQSSRHAARMACACSGPQPQQRDDGLHQEERAGLEREAPRDGERHDVVQHAADHEGRNQGQASGRSRR
jgi:hypothetical protein